MVISDFLTKANISMIWDVISDEDIFKFLSKNIQMKISEVFTNNLKGFYDNEIVKNNTLIDLNKKYILLMLNFIKNNYPQQPSKITILEELSPTNKKKLITYEEIHTDRKSQFENDLLKRQEEFTNAMTLKAPPVPDFNDKTEINPITEMELIIKEMTAQRNYDVEEINRGFNAQMQDDNWLKPQDTSIKNEKFQTPFSNSQQEKNNTTDSNSKLKYLKIDNEELRLLNFEQKKNVTWGENITKEFEKNEIIKDNKLLEENIFKKLKRVESTPNNINNEKINNEEIKKNILNITKRLSEMQEEIAKMNDFLKSLAC
jgi:hypothetical protein